MLKLKLNDRGKSKPVVLIENGVVKGHKGQIQVYRKGTKRREEEETTYESSERKVANLPRPII